MAWETSDRRAQLPPDWNQRVARIWKRDGGRCRWILPSGERCPRRGAEVDHRYDPERHDDAALWLLCSHHHGKKTQREAWAGRRKKKAPKKQKRADRHPGML